MASDIKKLVSTDRFRINMCVFSTAVLYEKHMTISSFIKAGHETCENIEVLKWFLVSEDTFVCWRRRTFSYVNWYYDFSRNCRLELFFVVQDVFMF